MKRQPSLQRKMNRHMLLFALLPLCTLLIVFLFMSFSFHLQETAADLASQMASCETDIQLIRTQTENVMHIFSTSDSLAHLLQARSSAEWVTLYNGEAYGEATRVEAYLASLSAKVILIFDDHDQHYSEHWATLLHEDRFQTLAYYTDFLASHQSESWCGLQQTLPEDVAHSFDFRQIGSRLIYLSRPYVISQRVSCTVACALAPDAFTASVERRLAPYPAMLVSQDQVLCSSLPADFPAPADLLSSSHLLYRGYLIRSRIIQDMGLTLFACIPLSAIVSDYFSRYSAILFLLLISVLLLSMISRRVLKALLQRLERLAVAADHIRGDKTTALPQDGDDEVGRVILAINRLLDRIEQQSQEKVRAEKDKRKMQALALQYQLNPHFLFNSLLWVQMEMERQSLPDHTSDAIATLGQVLRYNLTEDLRATLGEEIDHLQAYTAFMSEMKQESIALDIDASPALLKLSVPRFILQPITENALQHGLIPGEALHLHVCIASDEDAHLQIVLSNDGRPIDSEHLHMIREVFRNPHTAAKPGYGLANLIQRLTLTYGEQYTISVTSAPHETQFTLTLPLSQMMDGRYA